MVEAVAAMGVTDARVLEAMRAVPRHRFVESWVSDDADDDVLTAVHHPARALPTNASATTSVSSPQIVGLMLQALRLEAGTRVLEIGAGSGYNASLLAALVGDPSLVTTIDIDSSLIEPARRRLAAVGCAGVTVIEGDGDLGVPERAPYDRIIATVGCNELSAAWFEQLAPPGWMLIPLRDATGSHPIVRVDGSNQPEEVMPAGFVPIQGRQARDPA
jgi:protein-L-isoaspartate(D-aspartate) O-methyltransferase